MSNTFHSIDDMIFKNKSLCRAAAEGELESVSYWLLERGASLHARDEDGWTVVHYALYNDNMDIVQWLLRHYGSDVRGYLHAPVLDGRTAIHFASHAGNVATVEWLIQHTGSEVHRKDNDGFSALHTASRDGRASVVEYFIKRHGMDPEEMTYTGVSCLHLAVKGGFWSVVNVLLQNGGNVETRDACGWTAVHLACRYGYLELLQNLICKANANLRAVTSISGQTCWHIATQHRQLHVLDWLIRKFKEESALAINAADNYRSRPIHYASLNRRLDVLKLLLEQGGADCHVTDMRGNTPLHVALSSEQEKAALVLARAGCSGHAMNTDGEIPLVMAATNGYTQVVWAILQVSPDICNRLEGVPVVKLVGKRPEQNRKEQRFGKLMKVGKKNDFFACLNWFIRLPRSLDFELET